MSPTLTYSHWRVDGKTFVWVAEHYPLSAAVFPADKMVSGRRLGHLLRSQSAPSLSGDYTVMNADEVHVVTGAFGYSGKYIARRLLDRGCQVRTLTNPAHGHSPSAQAVPAEPFHFDSRKSSRVAPRRFGALQHLLGPLQPSRRSPLPTRSATANPVRCGPAGGRRADRPREHHQPVAGFAAGVFPRQGRSGRGPARLGRVLCHPASRSALRQGRHPHEQHGVDAPPVSGVGRFRPAATTGCSRSTSTTWRRWPSSKGPGARTRSSTPSVPRLSPTAGCSKRSAGSSASGG